MKKTVSLPPKRQLGARVDPDLTHKVRVLALTQRRRFNAMVEEAFKDLLKKYKRKV